MPQGQKVELAPEIEVTCGSTGADSWLLFEAFGQRILNLNDCITGQDILVEDPDDSLNPMGKPVNRQEALSMLLRLSGRNHRVWSGTAVISGDVVQSWITSATVSIRLFSESDLEALILSGSWKGKAGGYDLAGAMGQFAEIIDGDEDTILGLCPQVFNYLETKLE